MIRVEPIVPKKFLNAPGIKEALELTLDFGVAYAFEQYGKTVRTWSRKPRFYKRKSGKWAVIVTTDDRIYYYVNKGVKARIIIPKRKRMLRFAVGGSPKTRVRTLASYAGRKGGTVVWSKGVRWPGIKARQFDERVAEEIKAPMARIFKLRMSRALP